MLAHDITCTNRMNTDLADRLLTYLAFASIRRKFIPASSRKQQFDDVPGRTRRSILLEPVVRLNHFRVVLLPKQSRRLHNQPVQHVHTHREIGCIHDRNPVTGSMQTLSVLYIQPGHPADVGNTGLHRPVDPLPQARPAGEIHDRVRTVEHDRQVRLNPTRSNRTPEVGMSGTFDSRNDFKPGCMLKHTCNHRTHAAPRANDHNPHVTYPFSGFNPNALSAARMCLRFESVGPHSGKRGSPAAIPSMPIAALTGTGLVSMNSALISG